MRAFLMTLLLASGPVTQAATVTFSLVDNTGAPLEQAVFMLTATSQQGRDTASQVDVRPQQMTQKDKQFIPHVLPVQKGANVSFPNLDDIKHHVYSLSEAKQFDHIVDEGSNNVSESFEKVGQVNLGCNLHDWMLSYIFVVDTPYFMVTDADGKATLSVPEGETYLWKVWHPRITDDPMRLSALVEVTNNQALDLTLKSDLLPDYSESDDLDDFDDY